MKLRTFLLNLVLLFFVILTLVYMFNKPSGHYEPDYINPDGVLYDTDSDGDFYHWVDP